MAELRDDAVVLAVTSAELGRLPKPEPSPGVLEHHGVEDSESELQRKLSRAWDLISGKRY